MQNIFVLKSKRIFFSFIVLNLLTWVAVQAAVAVMQRYEFNNAVNDTNSAAAIFAEPVTH